MSVKIPVYPIVCEEILRPLRQVDDGINPYLSPNNDSHPLLAGGLIRLLLGTIHKRCHAGEGGGGLPKRDKQYC